MAGLLWDEGNLALAGRYGRSKDEADQVYASDRWIIRSRPTRTGQVFMIGAADDGRMLAITCERRRVRGRVGWLLRFRPIIVTDATRWQQDAFREASPNERGYVANVYRGGRELTE